MTYRGVKLSDLTPKHGGLEICCNLLGNLIYFMTKYVFYVFLLFSL